MNQKNISFELSRDEALVFFEWLSTLEELHSTVYCDPAEERIVWKLEGILERALVEPFDPNYHEIIAQAQRRVSDAPM